MLSANASLQQFTRTSPNTGSFLKFCRNSNSIPAALAQLYITSSFTDTNGMAKLIPLSAVAKLTRSLGPTSISHVGQLPAVTISFNLAPGVSLGTAVGQVQKVENDLHLPATITGSFQGAAAVFQSSVKGLGLLLVASILVIYIILGILYESFIHPLTILSGLPSAGFGALLTLMIFHLELEHLRLRRPHHARRHREEKRHHDD